MQVPCRRMKIQAISIAFESANQAPTKPLRRWLPARPNPFAVSGKPFAISQASPCLPNTWPVASALAPEP